jgi:hypothetical protein
MIEKEFKTLGYYLLNAHKSIRLFPDHLFARVCTVVSHTTRDRPNIGGVNREHF